MNQEQIKSFLEKGLKASAEEQNKLFFKDEKSIEGLKIALELSAK